MRNKTRVAISLEPEIIAILDRSRGAYPRSTFISNLIWFALSPEREVEVALELGEATA